MIYHFTSFFIHLILLDLTLFWYKIIFLVILVLLSHFCISMILKFLKINIMVSQTFARVVLSQAQCC